MLRSNFSNVVSEKGVQDLWNQEERTKMSKTVRALESCSRNCLKSTVILICKLSRTIFRPRPGIPPKIWNSLTIVFYAPGHWNASNKHWHKTISKVINTYDGYCLRSGESLGDDAFIKERKWLHIEDEEMNNSMGWKERYVSCTWCHETHIL